MNPECRITPDRCRFFQVRKLATIFVGILKLWLSPTLKKNKCPVAEVVVPHPCSCVEAPEVEQVELFERGHISRMMS